MKESHHESIAGGIDHRTYHTIASQKEHLVVHAVAESAKGLEHCQYEKDRQADGHAGCKLAPESRYGKSSFQHTAYKINNSALNAIGEDKSRKSKVKSRKSKASTNQRINKSTHQQIKTDRPASASLSKKKRETVSDLPVLNKGRNESFKSVIMWSATYSGRIDP